MRAVLNVDINEVLEQTGTGRICDYLLEHRSKDNEMINESLKELRDKKTLAEKVKSLLEDDDLDEILKEISKQTAIKVCLQKKRGKSYAELLKDIRALPEPLKAVAIWELIPTIKKGDK